MLSSSHVETMMALIKKMDVTYQLFYGDDLLGFIRTHREKHETIVVIIHTNTHKLKHINSKAILINII